jgi:hypothetical protein
MSRRPNRRAGFALVIALSLMAFLLLLILGLTTLIRVETSSGRAGKDLLLARQNALLGLMVGLGNLQAATGPDQRVTARGALFNDPDDGAGLTYTRPGNAFWTGVWDTSNYASQSGPGGPQDYSEMRAYAALDAPGRYDDAIAWLVSWNGRGPPPAPDNVADPGTAVDFFGSSRSYAVPLTGPATARVPAAAAIPQADYDIHAPRVGIA